MEAETPSLAHTCHTEVPNMSQLLLLSPPNEHSRLCRFPVFPQVCCENDLLVPIFHRVLPIGSQMLFSAKPRTIVYAECPLHMLNCSDHGSNHLVELFPICRVSLHGQQPSVLLPSYHEFSVCHVRFCNKQ
jgi:hypothetical protein